MLAGKAVVSTSQGAYGLSILHMEHCIIADNEADFANAILILQKDRELRGKLVRNSRKFAVENFGNVEISKKWVSIYDDAISRYSFEK